MIKVAFPTDTPRKVGKVKFIVMRKETCIPKKLDKRIGPTPSAYHDFIDSILEKRPPLATGDHGLKAMKIIEGIYRSAQTKKEIRYRPE